MATCTAPINGLRIDGNTLFISRQGQPDSSITLPTGTASNPVRFITNSDGSITITNGIDPNVQIPSYIATSPAVVDLIDKMKNSDALIQLNDAFGNPVFKAFPN